MDGLQIYFCLLIISLPGITSAFCFTIICDTVHRTNLKAMIIPKGHSHFNSFEIVLDRLYLTRQIH